MKFTAILFVAMILSITMASKLDSLKNAKFTKSKLGKFIMNFAEFTASISEVDYNPLYDALDALYLSLEDQLAVQNQQQADAEVTHNNLVINYENNRDAANSDIIAINQDLVNLAADKDLYETQIEAYNIKIEENNEGIVLLNSARNDRIAAYTQDIEDADSAIDTIDEALALLRSLQTTSDAVEFIQTNDQALSNIQIKLQKSFESLSNKKRTHYRYKPLLMAVVEIMSKQNFVNQDALLKIIDLLVSLRSDVSDFMAKLDSDEAKAEEQYQATLDALNEGIALANDGLATAEANLANTNSAIDSENQMLAQRTDEYNTAVEDLANENDLWNQTVQSFNEIVDEINSELRVVEEAVGALQAGGIIRSSV